MVRPVGVVVALLLVGAACSGDDDPGPSASVPTAATSSSVVPSTGSTGTTTSVVAAADPFAVPEVIDAAYVNRVLAALYAIDGDILRAVLASREPSEAVGPLGAVFGDPQLQVEIHGLPSVVLGDPSRFNGPPGDREMRVKLLLTAQSNCVVAVVDMNLAAVVKTPVTIAPDERYIVQLTPRASRSGQPDLNPTPWLITRAEIRGIAEVPKGNAPCG